MASIQRVEKYLAEVHPKRTFTDEQKAKMAAELDIYMEDMGECKRHGPACSIHVVPLSAISFAQRSE